MKTPVQVCVLTVLLGAASGLARAEPVFLDPLPGRNAAPIVNPDACRGGLRNDDGSFEGGVGYANAVQRGAYVMALAIPTEFRPRRVCVCLLRGPFNSGPDLDFDLVFYLPDGKGSKGEPDYPGTELARVSAQALNVPEFLVDGVAMYPVDLPDELAELGGVIHVGVEWEPFVNRQFFLCNDSEAVGSQERPVFEGYSNVPPEPLWGVISPMRPTYRAFGTVFYGDFLFNHDFEEVATERDRICAPGQMNCPD